MKEYFSNDELRCRCCGKLKSDPDFRFKLNLARDRAGIPFIIESGYRCPKHNAEEGSTSTNHTTGKGVDIRCLAGPDRYKIVSALLSVGFTGIGIHKTFIHADTNHKTPALWLY